jgi:pimeloyl-ACP methyl ester carboxylesterase
MSIYVLVHGAWHGGWCWQRVAPLLRAAGHDVYAPTLTGLGERVHLARPEIDLTTHIADVVNLIQYEDLTDIVLVGHSYGGMVITGAVDQLPDRIAHLVYLDAFVPQPGQSLFDMVGPELEGSVKALADKEGDGWRVPPIVPLFGLEDQADLDWGLRKFSPQPLGTFTEAAVYATPLEERPSTRTYIRARVPPEGGAFGTIAERLRSNPAWRLREIDTGHDVMITRPAELTELLLEEVAVAA